MTCRSTSLSFGGTQMRLSAGEVCQRFDKTTTCPSIYHSFAAAIRNAHDGIVHAQNISVVQQMKTLALRQSACRAQHANARPRDSHFLDSNSATFCSAAFYSAAFFMAPLSMSFCLT